MKAKKILSTSRPLCIHIYIYIYIFGLAKDGGWLVNKPRLTVVVFTRVFNCCSNEGFDYAWFALLSHLAPMANKNTGHTEVLHIYTYIQSISVVDTLFFFEIIL